MARLVTIYKNGTTQQVPDYDLPYYTSAAGGSWSTTPATKSQEWKAANTTNNPQPAPDRFLQTSSGNVNPQGMTAAQMAAQGNNNYGLTAAQLALPGIQNLINSKVQSQWTQTDWNNFNYAKSQGTTQAPTPPTQTQQSNNSSGSAGDSGTAKDWVGMTRDGQLWLNGKAVGSGTLDDGKNLAAKYGATWAGSFPSQSDITGWASKNGFKMDSSTPTVVQQNTSQNGNPINGVSDIDSFFKSLDTSNWSDSQKAAWPAVVSWVNQMNQNGKIVNPNITISPDLVAKFLEQAKSEVDPYNAQLIHNAQTDYETGFGRLAEDYQTSIRDIGTNYAQNLRGVQDNYARRGLEFSSDRTQAENLLGNSAQNQIDAAARATQRSAMDFGNQAERQIGSDNVHNLGTYNIPTGQAPVRGAPGVYGLTQASGTRTLFSPSGGVTGSLEQQRIIDERSRQQELINSERQLRGSNTM